MQIGYATSTEVEPSYRQSSNLGNEVGPSYWDVDVYQIDDVLPEDRLVLGPER